MNMKLLGLTVVIVSVFALIIMTTQQGLKKSTRKLKRRKRRREKLRKRRKRKRNKNKKQDKKAEKFTSGMIRRAKGIKAFNTRV